MEDFRVPSFVISRYTYSREAARLPAAVRALHRMVPLLAMFGGSGPARRIRQWLEAGAPADPAPTPTLRRLAYRRSSLANPGQLFTWATFNTPEWPLSDPPAAPELYHRLALDWHQVHRRDHALFLTYFRDQVHRIHVPGSKEAAGYPRFREVPAGQPYGLTAPLAGFSPLPEVVHDHWPGSGLVLTEPELLDPLPIGRVES